MVVLSALNDCSNVNFNIKTYFMIDAAVAMEAIQTMSYNPHMMYSTWNRGAHPPSGATNDALVVGIRAVDARTQRIPVCAKVSTKNGRREGAPTCTRGACAPRLDQ
jgi:hypothetical protein